MTTKPEAVTVILTIELFFMKFRRFLLADIMRSMPLANTIKKATSTLNAEEFVVVSVVDWLVSIQVQCNVKKFLWCT